MSVRTIFLGAALSAVGLQAGATPPAAVAEALASAGSVKTAVAEYAQTFGTWPAAGDENVVGAPKRYAGTYVARLDLRGKALIDVTLSDGAHVRLRPLDTDPTHTPMIWACDSPDIANIAEIAGQAGCAYSP